MGLSNSKPASKKNLTIYIKKAVVKDNHIYLFDKDNKMAKIIIEESIKHIPTDKIDHISSEISF